MLFAWTVACSTCPAADAGWGDVLSVTDPLWGLHPDVIP